MNAYEKMLGQSYEWIVKVAQDCYLGDAGDIISRHRTYNAAEKASKKHGDYTRIVDVRGCIFDQAILN